MMTLSTRIRILGDVSPEGVFATARQIIGIPNGHPFTIRHQAPDRVHTSSVRGGFESALGVTVALDGPTTADEYGDDEAHAPAWGISVWLDTGGRGSGEVHRRICAELGKWLETQGADWWANDEYAGEWHHRTPCPIARS